MPLDLSAYETEVDSPEVAALKKKIVAVAEKYKVRHGWCDAVDRAVAEIGIAPPAPVKITGKVLGVVDFGIDIPASDLFDKTDDQQAKAIAKQVGFLRVGSTTVEITPEMLTNLAVVAPPAPASVVGPGPQGHVWRKVDSGRVNHLFRESDLGRDFGIEPVCRQIYVAGYEQRLDGFRFDPEVSNCVRCTTRGAHL